MRLRCDVVYTFQSFRETKCPKTYAYSGPNRFLWNVAYTLTRLHNVSLQKANFTLAAMTISNLTHYFSHAFNSTPYQKILGIQVTEKHGSVSVQTTYGSECCVTLRSYRWSPVSRRKTWNGSGMFLENAGYLRTRRHGVTTENTVVSIKV
jgi:hypothetical protein